MNVTILLECPGTTLAIRTEIKSSSIRAEEIWRQLADCLNRQAAYAFCNSKLFILWPYEMLSKMHITVSEVPDGQN